MSKTPNNNSLDLESYYPSMSDYGDIKPVLEDYNEIKPVVADYEEIKPVFAADSFSSVAAQVGRETTTSIYRGPSRASGVIGPTRSQPSYRPSSSPYPLVNHGSHRPDRGASGNFGEIVFDYIGNNSGLHPPQVPTQANDDTVESPYERLARFRTLQRELGISDATFDKCQPFFNLRLEEQLPVVTMLFLAQGLEPPIHSPSVTAPAVRNHTYDSEFKVFVRSNIKSILLQPDVEQYGRTIAGHQHIPKSPMWMMKNLIEKQGKPFRSVYLPPSYDNRDDPHHSMAVADLISFIRNHVKNEKAAFAKLLLTGIRSDKPKLAPTVAIPDLNSLVAQIHREMKLRYRLNSDDEILSSLSNSTIIRISFLRIHLYRQYLYRNGLKEINWEIIDNHLEKLRSKSFNYRRAFYELMVEMDRKSWDGKTKIGELPDLNVDWPTDSEIEDRIASYTYYY